MIRYYILFLLVTVFVTTHSQELKPVRSKKGLWGFVNAKNDTVVKPSFVYKPALFQEERAIIKNSSTLFGVIDTKGNQLVAPQYYSITDFKNGYATVTKRIEDTSKARNSYTTQPVQKKYIIYYGMIDRNGKVIIPLEYEMITGDFSNGWFVRATLSGYRYRYFTPTGDTIAIPKGTQLDITKIDGKKFIASKNGRYGIIDNKWKEFLPFDYSSIRVSENGLLIASKNNRSGVLDNKVKWIVPPTYKSIMLFKGGYAIVQDTAGKYGAINEKGIVTTPFIYPYLTGIDKAALPLAVIEDKSNARAGLVNLSTGKLIIPVTYQFASYDYYNGFIVFRRDQKKGLLDSTGKELFHASYDDFSPGFLEGMAWVRKDGKYGFIDTKGVLVIPAQYESVRGFNSGVAVVKQNGKYGVVNKNGTLIVPAEYDDISSFSEGLAPVKKGNMYGYINTTGKLVLPLQYSYAGPFEGGVASVTTSQGIIYIDKTGK
jgi:WG containing repeat